jgi:hypothetical protein
LREPEELATDAIEELRAAVEDLSAVLVALETGNGTVSEDERDTG